MGDWKHELEALLGIPSDAWRAQAGVYSGGYAAKGSNKDEDWEVYPTDRLPWVRVSSGDYDFEAMADDLKDLPLKAGSLRRALVSAQTPHFFEE